MPYPKPKRDRERSPLERSALELAPGGAPIFVQQSAPALKDRQVPGDFANRARPATAGNPPRRQRTWRAPKPTALPRPKWQDQYAKWLERNDPAFAQAKPEGRTFRV